MGVVRAWQKLCMAFGAWGLSSLALACHSEAGPQLLRLESVRPELAEVGSTLSLAGEGFPERQTARVTLRGIAMAPGREPRDLDVSVVGLATSPRRIDVPLVQGSVLAITGGAHHVTFRGQVRVSFAALRAGAPALHGRLDGVTLDVTLAGGNAPRAPDFAAYLGLELDGDLTAVRVAPGSEGERVGLQRGDRLISLDGLRLLTPADLVPRPHEKTSVLGYVRSDQSARPGLGRGRVLVSRDGFRVTDPMTAWSALAFAVALLLGLLLAARPPRSLVWLLAPARERNVAAPATFRGAGRRARAAEWARLSGWVFLALGAALGARVVAALGPLERFDVPLLALLGAAFWSLAALLEGGMKRGRGRTTFGLGRSLLALAAAWLALVPLGVGLLGRAAEVGSLSSVDFALAQRLAPAAFGWLSSPWAAASGVLFFLSLLPTVGHRAPLGPQPRVLRAAALLEEVALALLLVTWVVLYGGGLGQPGASLGQVLLDVSRAVLEIVFLRGALSWLRAKSGELGHAEGLGLFVFPLALASLLVTSVCGVGLLWPELQHFAGPLRILAVAGVGSVLACLIVATGRSLSHAGRRTDPWL